MASEALFRSAFRFAAAKYQVLRSTFRQKYPLDAAMRRLHEKP
jgi:hypothetical protein